MILIPTVDVEVAEPEMESPERVVVPKPVLETISFPFTSKRPAGETVPIPTFPLPSIIKCVTVDEPIKNSGTPLPNALGLTERTPQGDVVPCHTLPLFC